MAHIIDIPPQLRLDDYEEFAYLARAVRDLRAEAVSLANQLQGRTIWMVNSTATGGGVAEMLPTVVSMLREVGVRTEWVVIDTDKEEFFALTKQLHNLIHGEGDPRVPAGSREVYESVNRENAEQMRAWVRPGDILAVHDPQPMPLARMLAEELDLLSVWRCHIGVDVVNEQTRAAWDFLRPYADAYAHAIFSAAEYIPDYFSTRATIVYPAVNPLTEKNRDLNVHKLVTVLANAALTASPGPMVTRPFESVAQRLLPDGTFAPANLVEEIGLLYRPIITQISRWDRLKGFAELMDAFALMKSRGVDHGDTDELARRRLELARLVLVGPDPASVADDPEGREVLDELIRKYREMDPAAQHDVALLALPMTSVSENALMVNAIQRTSTVVVQNSLREGFGLTVTEAMWKGVPVLSNRRAVGPRLQIRDGVDGCLIDDPRDVEALAGALERVLGDPEARARWGRSAQSRVHEQFLIFHQVEGWMRLCADTVRQHQAASAR